MALCQFFAWIEREVQKRLRHIGDIIKLIIELFSDRSKIGKTEVLGLICTLFEIEPFSGLEQYHEKLASSEQTFKF